MAVTFIQGYYTDLSRFKAISTVDHLDFKLLSEMFAFLVKCLFSACTEYIKTHMSV